MRTLIEVVVSVNSVVALLQLGLKTALDLASVGTFTNRKKRKTPAGNYQADVFRENFVERAAASSREAWTRCIESYAGIC
jgi:hypothetical protein